MDLGSASSVRDSELLRFMGILFHLKRCPHVWWHPLLVQWIKINLDGLAKVNPIHYACGGVFYDHTGLFIFGFGIKLEIFMSFIFEFYGLILTLELAKLRRWSYLWLEFDSRAIVGCLSSDV